MGQPPDSHPPPGAGGLWRAHRRLLVAGVLAVLALGGVAAGRWAARATPTAAGPAGAAATEGRVVACGTRLCRNGGNWVLYGATVYDAGITPPPSGIDNPEGTVSLAEQAHLNTIRLVNYYASTGDPAVAPFDEGQWVKVDRMIAAAGRAGMTIALDLADYRNLLWNACINPYASDWSRMIAFVGNRRNTVTHERYATDRTLSMVSIAGEPLPAGTQRFVARTTRAACVITYTTQDLTDFYHRTISAWNALGGGGIVTTGGLGYLDFNSGIDWKAIYALPGNGVCAVKTYGGMLHYVSTVTSYCAMLGKPVVDEEFGWKQSDGDSTRAAAYADTMNTLRSDGVSGSMFWNLGYEIADQSYEINPRTPLTFAAVQRSAP